MKNVLKFFLSAVLLAGVFTACETTPEEPGGPVDGTLLELRADKTEVYADGKDQVTFSVFLDDKDITETFLAAGKANARISDAVGNNLDNNVFTATNPKTYTYKATYIINEKTLTSEEVSIKAIAIPKLVLSSNKREISDNGTDAATFKVMLGSKNVTEDAKIFFGNEELTAKSFSNTTAGNYSFNATYTDDYLGELTSESIIVSVVARDPNKNVLFFQLTGTWCSPCSQQKTAMKNVLNDLGEHIVQIQYQVEDDISEKGEHASIYYMPNYIINDGRFGRLQYIPTTLIDFKEYYEGALTEEGIRSLYEDYIMDIPKTGMMISSSSSVGKVSVTVDVNARVAGEYSLGVMLVEDHVIAAQSGLSREYDHTNVARQLATEGLFGESLGTMTAGQVVNKQYTFDVESIYNASNLAFVVYTVFDEGKGPVVDNSIKVLVNQSGGYN